MELSIPGHEVIEVIKEAPDQRRVVLRTRVGEVDCVTRVVLVRVSHHFRRIVKEVALGGRGSMVGGVPEEARLILEGYRVRAAMGAVDCLPEVVDAGLASTAQAASSSAGQGFPFVTTRWVEGRSLAEGSVADPHEVLCAILGVLQQLHTELLVYGDLKPSNVILRPDGSVSLIDLDTLRQVPAATDPVALKDLTRHYAAPEQEAEQISYLSSDLFAFGVMARRLLGTPAGPWAEIVAACLRPNPMARPTAGDLLAAARGQSVPLRSWDAIEGGDATERVAEPGEGPGPASFELSGFEVGTERVAEPPAPLPSTSPPRPRRWLLGCLLVVGVPLLGGSGAAAWLAWQARQQALASTEADKLAAGVWEELQAFKTSAELNRDPAVLQSALVHAQEAAAVAQTPEALGVLALTRVWSDGWLSTSKDWDEEKYGETEALVNQAWAAGPSKGGALAAGLLTGAACRKQPASEQRDNRCTNSRRHLKLAIQEAERDSSRGRGHQWGWLVVEARWGAVMTEMAMAGQRWDDHHGSEAAELAGRATRHCEEARDYLANAPVNGIELAEDCVAAAGLATEFDAYLWWSDWILDNDLSNQADSKERRKHSRHIVRSVHPECTSISLSTDGRVVLPAGAEPGDIYHLCAWLGTVASGCINQADYWRKCADQGLLWCREYAELPGVPWKEALAEDPVRTSCAAN